jgi:hypothetical protein
MKKQVGDELVEMTADEKKLVTDYQTEMANKEQELADKAAAKAALLVKLGITADEAALLLG